MAAGATTFPHRCTRCGHSAAVPRALAVTCPVCTAPPGQRCVDLRYKEGTRRRVQEHDQRIEAVRGTDPSCP